MTNASLFNEALETTSDIWESQYQIKPVRNIRMPVLDTQTPVTINALWTDGGLRPSSNNLAFLIQHVSSPGELERWKQRLRSLPIRGGLLATSEELHLVQSDSSKELVYETLDLDAWRETLVSSKPHLFTPKALSQFRQGQLSLADLEETVSARSFTFLTRQQAQLDEAFQQGIDAALKVIEVPEGSGSSRAAIKGHVIRFSIAYLAARILQDKNFFGSGASIHDEDQDPITLLDRMVNLTNGFFRRAKESEIYVPDPVRQALVDHMGYRVSFVLTDHRDVGRLYERAIKKLPTPKELDGEDWGDLNRHYTPVKIAERMLEALPLERLRPEERYIFDPAAGSGSLLLAATSRLANMTDVPTGDERKAYLKNHVAGNDLDRYADLIAQLRYFLASESLGRVDEISQITDVLPFPSKPNFTHKDYEKFGKTDLPIKPRVIVANPPFLQEGKIQKAATFIQKALEWLDNDSQFAFILPQSFLTGTKNQVGDARNLIEQQCQILETWQFPEGVVGTHARQSTCVVIGIKSKPQNRLFTISRAIFSGAKLDEVRENGFLGRSWIASVNSDTGSWSSTITPPINIEIPTIPLGNLFYVFVGILFDRTNNKSVKDPLTEIKFKRYWSLAWKGKNKLWADPNNVPEDRRWVRYDPTFTEGQGLRLENETLFDSPKLLVGSRSNRNSSEPIVARLDTTGFCPNKDVFCVLPVSHAQKQNSGFSTNENPEIWSSLTYEEQRLWLLGLLTSKLLSELSLSERDSRGITTDALLRLPLPKRVDTRIIEVTKQIVQRDQDRESTPTQDNLRQLLNDLVENSYGNPERVSLQRIGISPELESWRVEQKLQTKTTIGQVLEIAEDKAQVYMYISRLMDDDDMEGVWIPVPQELPGWALDGTPFEAELSHDVKTFEQLRERPWALRRFRHTPRPYLTDDELDQGKRILKCS